MPSSDAATSVISRVLNFIWDVLSIARQCAERTTSHAGLCVQMRLLGRQSLETRMQIFSKLLQMSTQAVCNTSEHTVVTIIETKTGTELLLTRSTGLSLATPATATITAVIGESKRPRLAEF